MRAFELVVFDKFLIERIDVKAAVVIEVSLTEHNVAFLTYIYRVVYALRPPGILKVDGLYLGYVDDLATQIALKRGSGGHLAYVVDVRGGIHRICNLGGDVLRVDLRHLYSESAFYHALAAINYRAEQVSVRLLGGHGVKRPGRGAGNDCKFVIVKVFDRQSVPRFGFGGSKLGVR